MLAGKESLDAGINSFREVRINKVEICDNQWKFFEYKDASSNNKLQPGYYTFTSEQFRESYLRTHVYDSLFIPPILGALPIEEIDTITLKSPDGTNCMAFLQRLKCMFCFSGIYYSATLNLF